MPDDIRMKVNSPSGELSNSGGLRRQNWWVSPSAVAYHFGTSGTSVAAATAITHPLANSVTVNKSLKEFMEKVKEIKQTCVLNADVLKVRLQMQLVGQRGPLTGMRQILVQVVQKEGPRSLYLGLTPALMRSVLYGGLRLGLYEPSKYLCELAFESNNIFLKIASGAFSGAFATLLTNPVEVLKVRIQMNPNVKRRAIGELRKMAAEEGITSLWKGVGPAMVRASALTASQLATYDEFKRVLVSWTPLEEGFHLHLASSAVAGGVSTLITAPMDIIKTRLMLQRQSKVPGSYKNGFHCAYQVLVTEGSRGLYKGGFATFARLGPQTTITLLLCEKLRELAGLKAI